MLPMLICRMCIKLFIQAIKSRAYLILNLPKSFSTAFNTVPTIDNTIAPKIAGSQPLIVSPGTMYATIKRTIALTTKANNPKVTIVSGADIKLSIGLIKVLTTPKTIAASKAVVKLAT